MVRAKAGSVLGCLVAVCAILKALPYAYNLDLQETTPHLWRAFDDTGDSLRVLAGALATMRIKSEYIRKAMTNDYSTAVGLANYLVSRDGVSFRQAHSIVGELVRVSIEEGIPLERAAAAYLTRVSTKFGRRLVIDERTARQVLDPDGFLKSISTLGGSNPAFLHADLNLRQKELSSNLTTLSELRTSLKAAERRLLRTASWSARGVKRKS